MQSLLSYLFTLLCILTTGGLCVYWCYAYSLNDDLSVVKYKEFHETNDDVYPTMSFCLRNPFSKEALERFEINKTSYTEFLTGKIFDPMFLNISYDIVTLNLADFIKGYRIYYKNSTYTHVDSGLSIKDRKKLVIPSFSGVLGSSDPGFFKCFALNIPKIKELNAFRILLSNNIFPDGARPASYDLRTMVHLPKQLLLSSQTEKWIWSYRSKNESYISRCRIHAVEMVRKRDKKEQRCNSHWKDFDDWIAKLHINENKCRNVYQLAVDSEKQYPICDSQEKILRSTFHGSFVERKKYEIPCKTMERVNFEWVESDIETDDDPKMDKVGHFWLSISWHMRTFKEFTHTRYSYYILITTIQISQKMPDLNKYSIQFRRFVFYREISINMLIGNIGGYIGLLIGVSIQQLPALFQKFISRIKVNYYGLKK